MESTLPGVSTQMVIFLGAVNTMIYFSSAQVMNEILIEPGCNNSKPRSMLMTPSMKCKKNDVNPFKTYWQFQSLQVAPGKGNASFFTRVFINFQSYWYVVVSVKGFHTEIRSRQFII